MAKTDGHDLYRYAGHKAHLAVLRQRRDYRQGATDGDSDFIPLRDTKTGHALGRGASRPRYAAIDLVSADLDALSDAILMDNLAWEATCAEAEAKVREVEDYLDAMDEAAAHAASEMADLMGATRPVGYTADWRLFA